MATARNMQSAVINTNASGMTTLVSNPSTTAYMYVWQLFLAAANATYVQFFDGPGAISGNIGITAGTPINLSTGQGISPYFTIAPGSTFVLNDSVGVQKGGFFHYSN